METCVALRVKSESCISEYQCAGKGKQRRVCSGGKKQPRPSFRPFSGWDKKDRWRPLTDGYQYRTSDVLWREYQKGSMTSDLHTYKEVWL